jgi:hypothetical protein
MPEPRDPPINSPAQQSASDYGLDELVYMPNGEEEDETNVSLGKSVFQVDIFENIERPFLSGTVTLRDDSRVYDQYFDIKGTERLKIVFSNKDKTNPIKKRFVIRRVQSATKTNETTEVIIMNIIDETYFIDTVSRFSKAYKGTPEEIVEKILIDNLNKEVDIDDVLPIQEPMRVVVPFLTPIQAAQWVTQRATSSFGFPFYLYATLFDENLILKSMEKMFKQPVWNEDILFSFSQFKNSQETSLISDTNLYNIQEFKVTNNEDTLHLMERGAVGCSYNVFDATTGTVENFRFDVNEFFNDVIQENDLLGEDTKNMNSIMDDESEFEGVGKLSEVNGQTYDRIVSNNTYSDVANYYGGGSYSLDATAKALRNLVGKSSSVMRVGGAIFFAGDENRTIGSKINVYFPNNDPEGIIAEKTKDLKRSGEYVIHSCRHIFSDERHVIDAQLMKLGNPKE